MLHGGIWCGLCANSGRLLKSPIFVAQKTVMPKMGYNFVRSHLVPSNLVKLRHMMTYHIADIFLSYIQTHKATCQTWKKIVTVVAVLADNLLATMLF